MWKNGKFTLSILRNENKYFGHTVLSNSNESQTFWVGWEFGDLTKHFSFGVSENRWLSPNIDEYPIKKPESFSVKSKLVLHNLKITEAEIVPSSDFGISAHLVLPTHYAPETFKMWS